MHVLAVGVSDYARKDWRLNYAATDAKALGELLKAAAKRRGLYDDVRSHRAGRRSNGAGHRGRHRSHENRGARGGDVFVLYLAGHGRSVAGTYYFIPQDLVPGGGLTVMSHGIGQDRLQRWLARIPAQKSILILDTCESATATRSLDIERETAIDRCGMRLVAASSPLPATPPSRATRVTACSPRRSSMRSGSRTERGSGGGGLPACRPTWIGRCRCSARGCSAFCNGPTTGSRANFPLGARLAAFRCARCGERFPRPRRTCSSGQSVCARGQRRMRRESAELSPGAGVRVIVRGDWAIVAREGQKLGYVPAAALARPH